MPLADLVIDQRLDRWAGRLQWAEGRVAAARDAAVLIAALPARHVAGQVARVAARTGLDPATVTGEVTDAISRNTAAAGGDAWGRLTRRDRRADLDRAQPVTAPPTPVQIAGAGYPRPLTHALGPTATAASPQPAPLTRRPSSTDHAGARPAAHPSR